VLVLDTHVLLWTTLESRKLSRSAREAIRAETLSGVLAISDTTVWEIAWIVEHGRIQISGTAERFVREITAKLVVRPITPEIAALAARLPAAYPRDPIDRLIGATAVVEGAYLVTADQRIRDSQVIPTIW
jgi:PIN domain nuclease of toxin-antitoxin system